ncbi:molybdopterin-binding protein [Bradyrhizobium sp.]|uniref:molybdopterin-binding protein n=1 Tax=Bradyrhizobium sp. TaxID=376 RepID=UPI002D280D2D|nr:molybdopterin-binding protein [Bradyrhizobium sp.]HZR71818.1 molybdopterin-binding protein [Bradyrhizobium sp.]
MDKIQRLPPSLTALDAALVALLDGLEPVAVTELPPREALGCVAAEMAVAGVYPERDIALVDGWALRASDLVGASAYAPLPLTTAPCWVEAGDPVPDGCDCVIDADGIDRSGPIAQVLSEAHPGQGVRRRGDDFADGFVLASGKHLRPLDILFARAAGLKTMKVRRPRLRLVNVPATNGDIETAELIQQSARCAGADVTFAEARSRDPAAIAAELETAACDLLITIGGSGVGRTDAAVLGIGERGHVTAHGLALRPGVTTAIGRVEGTPVIALSGSPASAMAAWWTLGLPVLDRLSGQQPCPAVFLPLARKLASSVGIAEIALLERNNERWVPLALGDLSLQAIMKASAWLTIAGNSEGFAAGTPVGAYMLR